MYIKLNHYENSMVILKVFPELYNSNLHDISMCPFTLLGKNPKYHLCMH